MYVPTAGIKYGWVAGDRWGGAAAQEHGQSRRASLTASFRVLHMARLCAAQMAAADWPRLAFC